MFLAHSELSLRPSAMATPTQRTRLPRIIGPAHVPRDPKRVSASSEAPVPDTSLTLTHLDTQTHKAPYTLVRPHQLKKRSNSLQ